MTEVKRRDYIEILGWVLIALICAALLFVAIMPVHAEELIYSGVLESTGQLNSINYVVAPSTNPSRLINATCFYNIDGYGGLTFVYAASGVAAFPRDSWLESESTPVTLKVGTQTVGHGTFGFNYNSVTNTNAVWLLVDSFDIGTLSGTKWVNMTPDAGSPYAANWAKYGMANLSMVNWIAETPGTFATTPIGFSTTSQDLGVGNGYLAQGSYIVNSLYQFHNPYTIVHNTTTGSSHVEILKIHEGHTYQSRAYVFQIPEIHLGSQSAVTAQNFSLYVIKKPIKIAVRDSLNYWYNTTSLLQNKYYLTMNPTEINTGQTSFATLTNPGGDFNGISTVSYYYINQNGFNPLYNGTNRTAYNLRSGIWYEWSDITNTYSISKGATLPNPVPVYVPVAGNVTVKASIVQTDAYFQLAEASLTVTGANLWNTITVQGVDAQWGTLVNVCGIGIKNLADLTWQNNSASPCQWSRTYPPNKKLLIQVTGTGYLPSTTTKEVMGDETYKILMYLSGGVVPVGNTTLFVTVYEYPLNLPLSGATVWISPGQTKLTNSAGFAQFPLLINATNITMTVNMPGFIGSSGVITLNAPTVTTVAYLAKTSYTVSPTETTLPPGVTVPVTLDTRTSQEKQTAGAKIIFDNIEGLISVAVIATMIGFMKIMGKW